MKILIVGSVVESLEGFRGQFIDEIVGRGHEVHVAAPAFKYSSDVASRFKKKGVNVHNLFLIRTGLNPFADLLTFLNLFCLLCRIRPDCVFSYTVKPVIYSSLAARLIGVPNIYALITGVGYAFSSFPSRHSKLVNFIVSRLYRLSISCVKKVFFQNPDDALLFKNLGIVSSKSRIVIVNGSGVDLNSFAFSPQPPGPVHFILISRLLVSKGVREYLTAAARVKLLYPDVRFSLAGWFDKNPDSIEAAELDALVQAGTVSFLGRLSDVRPAIVACSVYVLPSYREGTPRTVLEAMSMGRAVITTDAPGCRETVVDGDNGFLVPVRSVDALVNAMAHFIIAPTLAARMGRRGRQLAEHKYDVHKVNSVMLKEMGIE